MKVYVPEPLTSTQRSAAEVGEGELARVLAAVEALASQVGDISTAVQQHIRVISFLHRLLSID